MVCIFSFLKSNSPVRRIWLCFLISEPIPACLCCEMTDVVSENVCDVHFQCNVSDQAWRAKNIHAVIAIIWLSVARFSGSSCMLQSLNQIGQQIATFYSGFMLISSKEKVVFCELSNFCYIGKHVRNCSVSRNRVGKTTLNFWIFRNMSKIFHNLGDMLCNNVNVLEIVTFFSLVKPVELVLNARLDKNFVS